MEETKNQSAEEVIEEVEQADESTEEVVEETEESELSEEQAKIKELENQVADFSNRLLRATADYDNFRRRTKEEREAASKYRAQSLVEQLLPALDNFERALMVQPEHDETKSLLQGMEMVYRQLQDAMKNEGVEAIQAVGEQFDPHLHQAVMQVEDSNFEANSVVEELQKGYKLKDRVLRPAMVKVNS
ncbi:nucleotide exchange factor GrpE [Bacillus sp. FJAT-45350]|uniref:nucleotide exchange factor GrpE n=1 Tax=Bacillus sp. FJAT-45350 TaxID=2011014 RepID=UPI00211C2A80|nr:nucleotide exchange factor GrpE [Bacillus sp. FJAT-45350]